MSFLEHQGRTLCYRLLGDPAKPLMLLAHPLGMNQTVWDEMLPALLGHFRTLTWDLPGHGSSSAWPEQAVTAADLAAEALTLAAVAGAERFLHYADGRPPLFRRTLNFLIALAHNADHYVGNAKRFSEHLEALA